MVDIKLVRSNPDAVKAAVKKREMDLDALIDDILGIDEERRALMASVEALKARQNAASKQIPQMKKAGEDTTALMAEMKTLSETVKEESAKLQELDDKQKELMYSIPNLPDEDLLAGGKENNAAVHYFKEQRMIGDPESESCSVFVRHDQSDRTGHEFFRQPFCRSWEFPSAELFRCGNIRYESGEQLCWRTVFEIINLLPCFLIFPRTDQTVDCFCRYDENSTFLFEEL